jgi:uncharacterized membrane protein
VIFLEALLALVGLVVAFLVLVSPILALVAFVRAGRASREADRLRSELTTLEARLNVVVRRLNDRLGATPAEAPLARPAAEPVAVPPTATEQAAAPAPLPVVPPAELAAQPRTAAPPRAPEAPVPPRAPEAAPVAPVAAESAPQPAAEPGPRPPAPPPAPPRPARPAPAAPAAPAFDWESLLGVKGAAIVGAIAVVIAGILLAKLAIDAGLLTPELRVAMLIVAGVGSLLGAEFSLRRGYETQANAVSGAGIALLYAGLFAGHGLYGILPLAPTFGMMVLVTFVAGLLAIRYDAWFTAVLGLLGGFATPVALSTGHDNPVGLFSYILLLNLGLGAMAIRKRWHGLVLLGLACTFLIEAGWFARFMAPEKMLIALLSFGALGLLYALLPLLAKEQEDAPMLQLGAAGGAVPFLFGLLIAGQARYAGEWPLLFGFLGLLEAALLAVGVLRERKALLLAGSFATALTLPLWAAQGLSSSRLLGPTLAAIVLALIPNAASRLARWLGREAGLAGEVAGAVGAAGLGLFALVLVGKDLGVPPWPFLLLLVALVAILVERTGEDRLPGLAVVFPALLAGLTQLWFFRSTGGDDLTLHLALPLLLTIALSLLAGWRADAPVNANEDEAGVVVSALGGLAGLFLCLAQRELGNQPLPLFAALAVGCGLLLVSALRRDWPWLLPLAMAGAALHVTLWQAAYFEPADLLLVLPVQVLFYLAFLALPFLARGSLAFTWRERRAPWIASALAGPAFFLALHDAVSRGWGKGWIGLLPLLMAALTLLALAGVSRRFAPRSAIDTVGAALQLRWLALFAAVALGLVAVAIPLQLDRQWITVAWALQAAAVFRLYDRLPHPGLKVFGAVLFAAVGARLLLNPEVARYQDGGLPILNWLLYTYGVPALCCLFGAAFLRRAEARLGRDEGRLPDAVSLLGLLLVFALCNVEVDHAFRDQAGSARDLARSAAWALYAVGLLVVGVWRQIKSLRWLSLGFLLLTVAKVFLYDLSNVTGVYRIFSFLGLGVSLILVSLFYQRFVFGGRSASGSTMGPAAGPRPEAQPVRTGPADQEESR